MPYRRLPNTDQSRLRAFRIVLEQEERQTFNTHVVAYKTLHEARTFLNVFEKHLQQYKQCLENQVNANKKYQQIIHNARLFISHFIQVFNLSVIRGDIKKDHKKLYQLDPESHTVPDLSTEHALLHWGKCIIDGENERIKLGGLPIYNPAIAKVKVHYEVFKEYKTTQKLYQSATTKSWEDLVQLREKGDQILLEIWNQVEEYFKDEKPYLRLQKCQSFGLVFYYRKGEEVLKPDQMV